VKIVYVVVVICFLLLHTSYARHKGACVTPQNVTRWRMAFGDDKKGKVLGTGVINVSDYFTLNDVALVDRLRYNLLSISQLVDTDLSVLFCKSDSHVLDSSGKRVCDISCIVNVFQANFSSAQSSLSYLISHSSEL
jgi:hypothetical protein